MFRTVTIAIGVVLGALFSQAPEYTQQYRQRLGGAIDELARFISDFDRDAEKEGLERPEAIERLQTNADPLVEKRGERIVGTIDRHERLLAQREAMETSGPVMRMVSLARHFDGEIGSAALDEYEPAVPVTIEGFLTAAVGFFLALFGGETSRAVIRRHRAKREQERRNQNGQPTSA